MSTSFGWRRTVSLRPCRAGARRCARIRRICCRRCWAWTLRRGLRRRPASTRRPWRSSAAGRCRGTRRERPRRGRGRRRRCWPRPSLLLARRPAPPRSTRWPRSGSWPQCSPPAWPGTTTRWARPTAASPPVPHRRRLPLAAAAAAASAFSGATVALATSTASRATSSAGVPTRPCLLARSRPAAKRLRPSSCFGSPPRPAAPQRRLRRRHRRRGCHCHVRRCAWRRHRAALSRSAIASSIFSRLQEPR
mmetsp:Transcript_13452/g.47431  ORF Transcript_13452/g.47431 Transcript_13452/m.47431 type:complete len:249 (-) Transcript_13452:1018-1764(-)